MASAFFEILKNSLREEPPLHPVASRQARRWVKERLKRMFPALRNDPVALEKAYRSLSLEAHEGCGTGGATLFEIVLPGHLEE